MNPLVQLFEAKNIRIFGSVEEPLFCAIDVAQHIEDGHVDRVFEDLLNDGYACWQIMHVSAGDARKTLFLSELGLYRYLLKSKKKLAEPFQQYTYDLLTAERKRVVDSEKLALKIQKTHCATVKKEEATALVLCVYERKEKYDFIRAANIARDECRTVDAKIAELEEREKTNTFLQTCAAPRSAHTSSEDGSEGDSDEEEYPVATEEDLKKEDREYENIRESRNTDKNFQLRRIDREEAAEIFLADEEEKREIENSLIAIFEHKKIRISGTVHEPLFHAADVAQHIRDARSAHNFRAMPENYIKWVPLRDAVGRTQNTRFLTEPGLYRYLLQSECKDAEGFQKYTYNLLQKHRKRIVDSLRLAVKIQKDRAKELEAARLEARKAHKVVRVEFNGYIAAANIGRDKLRESKKKLEELENKRLRVAEEQQITRYWSPFVPPSFR